VTTPAASLPQGADALGLWAWTLDLPGPSRDSTTETSGFSQVPGWTPMCACPGLVPRRTLDARPDTAPRMLPSAHPKTSAPRSSRLSRLITTAYTLAVYASQVGLPRFHARLASGGWPPLPGRVGTYWVHDEGFQVLSIAYTFLPSQAWPGARGVSTVEGLRSARISHASTAPKICVMT
jgi:hypothetical protein